VERPAGRTTLTALVRRRHWAAEEDGGTADEPGRPWPLAVGVTASTTTRAGDQGEVLCRTSIVEQVTRAAGADGRAEGRRPAKSAGRGGAERRP
jgi:hypothetical protein